VTDIEEDLDQDHLLEIIIIVAMVDMRGEVEVEVGIDIEEVHQDMI
jgi:hypothetical protein